MNPTSPKDRCCVSDLNYHITPRPLSSLLGVYRADILKACIGPIFVFVPPGNPADYGNFKGETKLNGLGYRAY